MALVNRKDLGYKMKIGDPAPRFSLPGTDSSTHSLDEFAKDALVVFFWCNHCPYVHAAEPQVIDLAKEFGECDFVAINSNDAANYPEDSFPEMQRRAEEKGYPFSYLHDETQEVAKAYGGECTPHFFVFDSGRKLVYQGRCDDAGMRQGSETTHELRDALEDLRAKRDIAVPLTNATGCSIKWR